MNTEFEVKILEIDVDEIVAKLAELDAKKIGEKKQRRFVYDLVPKKENSWIRLRTDGQTTTMALKEIQNDKIDGTKEIEILVDDFDKVKFFLEKLGYKHKSYQENKRTSYVLEGVEIEIDLWPLIPPYMEIEGRSVDEVQRIVKLLGFELLQTTSMSVIDVYKKYDIDISAIKELKFESKNEDVNSL